MVESLSTVVENEGREEERQYVVVRVHVPSGSRLCLDVYDKAGNLLNRIGYKAGDGHNPDQLLPLNMYQREKISSVALQAGLEENNDGK